MKGRRILLKIKKGGGQEKISLYGPYILNTAQCRSRKDLDK